MHIASGSPFRPAPAFDRHRWLSKLWGGGSSRLPATVEQQLPLRSRLQRHPPLPLAADALVACTCTCCLGFVTHVPYGPVCMQLLSTGGVTVLHCHSTVTQPLCDGSFVYRLHHMPHRKSCRNRAAVGGLLQLTKHGPLLVDLSVTKVSPVGSNPASTMASPQNTSSVSVPLMMMFESPQPCCPLQNIP